MLHAADPMTIQVVKLHEEVAVKSHKPSSHSEMQTTRR